MRSEIFPRKLILLRQFHIDSSAFQRLYQRRTLQPFPKSWGQTETIFFRSFFFGRTFRLVRSAGCGRESSLVFFRRSRWITTLSLLFTLWALVLKKRPLIKREFK